ncbi:MAG: hypothetical protein K9N05_02100 [Candidatus Marinimicrobia bacterium]|nr:hypothetical protein [Candidatus Neomarinimicrobiota bacterium]
MKNLSTFLALIFLVFGFWSCTIPLAEDEVEAEISVIGLYPTGGTNYSVLLSKSVRDYVNYNYLDSLLFVQIDSSGNEISSNGISLTNGPYIRENFLLDDGNIMLFGNLNSESYTWNYSTQVYTPTGNLVWRIDMANKTNGVCPSQDGNLFVFGWDYGDYDYDDLTYAKIEPDADTLWNFSIPGISFNASISSGTPTADNGFIAIGDIWLQGSSSDILTSRVSSTGDTLWTGIFGGDRYDDVYFADILSDGSVMIIGALNVYDSTNSNWWLNSGEQVYLIKLTADGDKLWTKAFGNTLREEANAFIEASDGSLLLCGTRNQSSAYLYDETVGWVSKLSSDGEEVWLTEFENKLPVGIRELPDGDFLVVTSNLQEDSYYRNAADLNIIKLTSSGTLLWNRVLTP